MKIDVDLNIRTIVTKDRWGITGSFSIPGESDKILEDISEAIAEAVKSGIKTAQISTEGEDMRRYAL